MAKLKLNNLIFFSSLTAWAFVLYGETLTISINFANYIINIKTLSKQFIAVCFYDSCIDLKKKHLKILSTAIMLSK